MAINIKPKKENERGIPKKGIDQARVNKQGVQGDFNRYRSERKRNTLDQAILLLHKNTIDFLVKKGWPVEIGHLGENITLQGEPSQLEEGMKLRIGATVLQVTKKCFPCNNLKALPYVNNANIEEFKQLLHDRRGWYAMVLQEGTISVGNTVKILPSQ